LFVSSCTSLVMPCHMHQQGHSHARLFAAVLALSASSVVHSENADSVATSSSSGVAPSPKPRRSRIRSQCAPELGLIAHTETAVAYAKHSQTFCNTSSPWAEKHANITEVVGFVAPWLDHSYRAARYFKQRLTSVSPLWFRILPGKDVKASSAYEIAGLQLAKEQDIWKSQVTAGDTEFLPHFSIEGFDKLEKLKAILEEPQELAAEIAVTCDRLGYQGIIFDVRLALFRSLKSLLPRLIKALAQALHGSHRRLLLSVPAMPLSLKGPDFDAEDAAAVANDVDAIILGTRDFTRGSTLGPSAPLPWVRSSVQRLLGKGKAETGLRPDQLIIEIPLYGRAFAEGKEEDGKVILTGEIAKALAKQRPRLAWDDDAREHTANITSKGDRVGLSLPTLSFVAERLQLASSLGVGVAFRDVGSGLDYAFDLLPLRTQEEFDNLDDDPAPSSPESVSAKSSEL